MHGKRKRENPSYLTLFHKVFIAWFFLALATISLNRFWKGVGIFAEISIACLRFGWYNAIK
jgi:hypothetical protein